MPKVVEFEKIHVDGRDVNSVPKSVAYRGCIYDRGHTGYVVRRRDGAREVVHVSYMPLEAFAALFPGATSQPPRPQPMNFYNAPKL